MAKKDIGELLASDDEVQALKPRGKKSELIDQPGAVPVLKEATMTIALEENDNIPPTGQFIALNGRTWILRPGEACEVPMGLVNVLNDAVMSVPNVDPVTKQIVGYRQKLRFPYRIVQLAAA
jgi:hypothetical protein